MFPSGEGFFVCFVTCLPSVCSCHERTAKCWFMTVTTCRQQPSKTSALAEIATGNRWITQNPALQISDLVGDNRNLRQRSVQIVDIISPCLHYKIIGNIIVVDWSARKLDQEVRCVVSLQWLPVVLLGNIWTGERHRCTVVKSVKVTC